MDDIIWPPKKPAEPKTTSLGQTEPMIPDEPELAPTDDMPVTPDNQPLPESSLESETVSADTDISATESLSAESPKIPRKKIYFKPVKLSKQQWVLIVLIVIAMIGGGAYGAKYLFQRFGKLAPQPAPIKIVKPKVPPKPKTEASRLTGLQVDPALNKRPVTGIMIENSPDARPQSGLKDAGIVYEAIAEGGITRFLTLFQEAQPDYIGPVRSVRPYYLDFLLPFDAPVAHVGGAPQALSDIKALGIKDLDEFANSGSYWRISQRAAPHNVYTSFARLDALNNGKGFTSSTFTGFTRRKATPLKVPTAKTIDLSISGPLYNAHYVYDAVTNSYKRSEGGAPHIDERSGAQLSPNVVVALVMSRGIDSDGQHTDYTTTGTGHMFVFQDGGITEGSWSKAGRRDQFIFTDTAGKVLALNPGQTWISLVDAIANVTYAP